MGFSGIPQYNSVFPAGGYSGADYAGHPAEDVFEALDAVLFPAGPQEPDRWGGQKNTQPCKACDSRRYFDVSNDPGVSFKTPTKISPEAAASAVRAHENEHIVNEKANAQRSGGEVISQSVSIRTSVCPECKKVYVSGGEARTTVRYGSDAKEKPESDAMVGKNMNIVA